jgi:4-hydroxybenzoate polyprenyltransferase
VLGPLSQRLLTLFQFTRMALVFTAISNSMCEMLLFARYEAKNVPGGDGSILPYLDPQRLVAMACVSIGLYGFGMSLNDIIDRRRDRLLAADRPLPSGRIGVRAAHVVCTGLALLALVGGWYVAHNQPGAPVNFPTSFLLLVWTASLITFYDFAGKYLVAPGLISLGLIRFFHAAIPAPQLPNLWHPLLLLNHVTILSAVCYRWEHKRPSLTPAHWWAVLGGLGFVDAVCIALVFWRRQDRFNGSFADALWITPALLLPLAAVVVFIILALWIRRRMAAEGRAGERRAGQVVMLYGLLWLIVYDVTFAVGYVGVVPGLLLLCLLPMAYLSVKMMRAWSRVLSLSQKPEFQRAR